MINWEPSVSQRLLSTSQGYSGGSNTPSSRLFLFLAGGFLTSSSLKQSNFLNENWACWWPQAALKTDQQINFYRGTKEISKKVFPETFQFFFVIKRWHLLLLLCPSFHNSYSWKNILYIFIILIFNHYLSLLYWLRFSALFGDLSPALFWSRPPSPLE